MDKQTLKHAVGAIRVSTEKQGKDGDSPEDQREQIERYALSHGYVITKFFVFLESASKEQQPMQEAIDYCMDPKNKVETFIIKSIDRFTRGGSLSYNSLKQQLDQRGITLVDIYGIISGEKINTLDHVGFKYRWSEYSPSHKSEILEAERSKDELRDIMTRVIGAEIRYTQLGYWMRQPPYGFISEKIETKNGRRCILKPHPVEADFVRQMFKLRARGNMTDPEIVNRLNLLGCRTRVRNRRIKQGDEVIITQRGGDPLTTKAMQKMIKKTTYIGINCEKWTNNKPIKAVFDGLVSVDTFNAANRGDIKVEQRSETDIRIVRGVKSKVPRPSQTDNYAYRKYVRCPKCRKPLLGSAARGKNGKHYPAYHCSNYGHYFRVPKATLESLVTNFIESLTFKPETIERVITHIESLWDQRENDGLQAAERREERLAALRADAASTIRKMKVLSSESAVRYMEDELVRIESEIAQLEAGPIDDRVEINNEKEETLQKLRKLMEHPIDIYKQQIDDHKKAQFFALFFDEAPTYEDLQPGTPKTPLFTGVNSVLKMAFAADGTYGDLTENRTPIAGMKTRCPNR